MEKIVHEALKSNPNGYVTKGVCMYAFVYVRMYVVCLYVRVRCNNSCIVLHS